MIRKQITYMPDLSKISLDEFKNELKTGRLLPSRKPLLDEIDAKFTILKNNSIITAENLLITVKIISKLKKLALDTGISEEYLKLLKREANNLLPIPIKFHDIPNISIEIVNKLHSINIVDTETLFPFVRDSGSRKIFEKTSGFSTEEILWLTKIVDLSRIKWVGPKLARLLVDTKYDTLEKLAVANPSDVLKELNRAKYSNSGYQGALGIDDIDSWIHQVVNKIPLAVEY